MTPVVKPLSKWMKFRLRQLAGDKGVPTPRTAWEAEMITRGLIDRGLINPVGWTLTDAGRDVLAKLEG